MKRLGFELSMPNVGSWNGKWSSASKFYFRSRNLKDDTANRIMAGKPRMNFYYDFGDGWGANVAVYAIDAIGARKFNKASAGFCGYEWMIDSIVDHGKILNDAQQSDIQEAASLAPTTPKASSEQEKAV